MKKHVLLKRVLLAIFISIGVSLTGHAQTVIYVNDASTSGDVFTTAAGNDANDGLSPGSPVATIAGAISKSVSGSKILIDAGNYSISSTILNGIKLVGSGKEKTIIDINGGSIQMMSNSELWNSTITKSKPANASPTISVATNGGENMHIEGCHFSKNRSAIYIEPGTQNITIKGNTFNDNRTGIIFPGGNARLSTVYIYDNDINNNRTWGIVITENPSTDAEFYIANNNLTGNKAGALNNDNTSSNTKLFLRNNFFGIASPTSHPGTGNAGFTATLHEDEYEWENVIFTTTSGHPYHISGNNIAAIHASSFHSPVVLNRTATTNFITSSSPAFNFHHSILDAINASASGATITLPDGIYNEDVNVNKSVTINGTSQSGTVILGTYDWQKTVNIFNIGAINVNVNNLTISRDFGGSATGWANSGKNQGLIINSNNATIDKVLVKDQRNGIYINNRQNLTLTNSTVKDSRTGLHMVNNVSDATIRNNSFTNNFTHGVMFNADGVALNLTNSIITDNQITGNWFTQLYFHKTTTGGDPILTNSTINCNSFGSSEITINNSAAGEPGYNVKATSQSGGASSGTAYTFGGNQIENHYSKLSLWRNNSDADTDLLGFQIPSIYTVSPVSGAKSALNNNYRVLANALGCANSGDQITLNGDFDWTETHAQADWAKGMDANSGTTGDNYKIAIQTGKNNIHLKGTTGTKIKGPGDLPEANLESFLSFPTTGVNKNWKISDLEIEGFDLSIYFGSTTSGGADSLKIYNNTFRIPKDLTDDLNQNIGVHLSNGKGIEVYNNKFYLDGTGESGETTRSNSNALQSTTSGGILYDGLRIYNNNVIITGTPHATKPSYIIGFWENSQSRGANIELYNNVFTNEQPGNLPANNRQMAFRVTSRSGTSGSVKYFNNEISGFNRGIDRIGDPYSTVYGPLTYEASSTPVLVNNNRFDNVSFGVSVRKDNTSSNTGSPAMINQNSFTNIGEKAIVYEGNNGVTETNCNWFGTDELANIENMVSAPNGGSINYNLRLSAGTSISGTGFTPNGLCIGTVKNVTKNTFHLTIQEAINAAAAGDEILASAGTYNEQLTINKPLTLKGAQTGVDPRPSVSSSRTIDGPGETIVTALKSQTILAINAANVTIDGFQFKQEGTTGGGHTISNGTNQQGLTLTNNIITSTGFGNAMRLFGEEGITISQNYLKDIAGEGIVLRNGNLQATVATNQKIINNDIINVIGIAGAIYVYGETDLEISGNIIESKFVGASIGAPATAAYYYMDNIDVHHNTIRTEFPTTGSTSMTGLAISGIGTGINVYNNTIEQNGPSPTAHSLISIGHDADATALVNPSGLVISNNRLSLVSGSTGKYIRVSQNIKENIEANCNWFGTSNFAEIKNLIEDKSTTGFIFGVSYLTSGVNTLTSSPGFEPEADKCEAVVKNITKGTLHGGIQKAIDLADSDDIIEVAAGTFAEAITINKPLTLKGAQTGIDPRPSVTSTRTINGADETIITAAKNAIVISITSDDVVIDGIQVTQSGGSGTADAIKAIASQSGITITNTIVNAATDEAIQLEAGQDYTINKNYILNPIGDGITLSSYDVSSNKGINQKIQDNDISGSTSAAGSIYLYGIKDVEISGNVIDTKSGGIALGTLHEPTHTINVHHNTINTELRTAYSAAANGIGMDGNGSDIIIANNLIKQIGDFVPATANKDRSNLIRIGISNAANPTNVLINENHLERLGNENYIYINSGITNKVNITCNWLGETVYPNVLPAITGTGQYNLQSFLKNETNTVTGAGFEPEADACFKPVHNITQNNYAITIQNAVNNATNGDTLLVNSGTYDEQVLVNKSVVIAKGAGESRPIVKFSGTVTGKPALFDVSADEVAIDSLRFEVDLTKLKSAVIASAAGIDKFTFINNEIYGQGVPPGGTYSDRNAVSVNHTGNTNYRVATGGVDNIVFSNNKVDGEEATFGFFRAALAVDEGAVTAKGNTLRTINHDILVRFNSKNPVEITDNIFNGGGVEIAEQNGGSGKITLSDNAFNGVGAPNYALLRVKNNQSGIEHEISNNTFNDYKWAISLENMKDVTVEANTFTTSETAANAVVINTKSMSSNSSDIVQTTISATVRDNDFAGTGRGIVFLNHDSQDASFGTFVIGESGKENKFSSTLSSFIALDNQTGPSSGSTFPIYGGSTGTWVTPMACWSENINAENNRFDVGSGLKSPAALNAAERETLESKLTHKPDFACIGSIQFFNPVHNITQNTYFSKIQDAVNAAAADDTIELSEWTFTESVEIGKSLTIQGLDKAKVILNGAGLATGSAIKINSGVKNVTVKNLTIQNFNGTNPNSTAGVYAAGSNDGLIVKNIDVKNNTNMSGFYANGPVNGISIDSSSFANHGPGARGIVIWNGLKSNISLTNNYLSSNNCCGIELQDGAATGVLIKGNTVYAEDSGISAVGLTSGSGNSKANIIDSNFVFVKQRFGIEIKNPNGTGNDDPTEDGAIIVSRNEVTHNGPLTDLRDLAGIAVHRRGVSALNVDVPTGVIVKDNKVSGFIQPSLSTGFGIVVEGTNHTATGNTLTGNDVGIQQQSGHLPYPADGDQNNVDDMYFGRGNSPIICNLTVETNTFSGNTLDQRILVNGAVVTEITPTVDPVSAIEICNNTSTTAVAFTGNAMTGKVYKWTNSHPSIGLAASGTGNIASFTVANTTLEPIVSTITVTPELPNGCKGTPVEFTITVNPTPEKPVINPAESTICEGSEVTLVTTCLVGTAHWSNSMTGSSITVSPVVNTSYTVKCIDALGCEGTVSNAAVVNVIARPAKPTLTASATTICNGLSVLLTASSCVDGKYIWSTGAETTENTLSVSPASTQNYTVTCSKTATLTCVSLASDPVNVTVNTTTLSAPTTSGNVLISSGATTTLTATCSTGTPAWFDLAETLVGSGASFTTPALTVNTDYNVRCVNSVTNLTDCKSSTVLQRITIDNFAVVNHPQHIYVCLGQNAFLSVGATGRSITYQWEEFNGTSWTALTNTGKYSGVNSNLLNIQAPGLTMSDYRYRCVITNTAPDAVAPLTITSNPGVLTISSAAMANNITMVSPITGLNVMYQAVQTIIGSNKINSGNIKYFAGNSITLEPGFEVTPGSVFTAKIQIPCTNTSPAVPIPDKIKY